MPNNIAIEDFIKMAETHAHTVSVNSKLLQDYISACKPAWSTFANPIVDSNYRGMVLIATETYGRALFLLSDGKLMEVWRIKQDAPWQYNETTAAEVASQGYAVMCVEALCANLAGKLKVAQDQNAALRAIKLPRSAA